jgi:alkanesulfonate monooxygenase SsuD/methylene tetrahydromethanopterin reductase-like flavin-dependent oxidoreductase (luciferase family)
MSCGRAELSGRVLRVGVRLPDAPGRIGDYLADSTALEAGGADSIWLDISTEASIEPWILLGSSAAVPRRVRLGIRVGPAAGLPATVDKLMRLSGGRVVVGARYGRKRIEGEGERRPFSSSTSAPVSRSASPFGKPDQPQPKHRTAH